MKYKKIFDPNNPVDPSNPVISSEIPPNIENLGDRSSKSPYVYDKNIVLAINIALATGRPLLVRGASGWGKSSLARNVADILGWRYYEKVISSRMQARDLLWDVDMIRRLHDAQMRYLKNITVYIRPGILWKAFNLESAMDQEKKVLSSYSEGLSALNEQDYGSDHPQAVVLLDEIDKADPDFPNDLLVPLGSLYFTIEETGTKVKCEKPPLVFVTTNDERTLPPAFLRRCVELKLSRPDLLEVGKVHFDEKYIDLVKEINRIFKIIETEQNIKLSPAEFIDVVRTCINLNISKPESDIWNLIIKTKEI